MDPGRNSGDGSQAVAIGLGLFMRHLGSRTLRAWTGSKEEEDQGWCPGAESMGVDVQL